MDDTAKVKRFDVNLDKNFSGFSLKQQPQSSAPVIDIVQFYSDKFDAVKYLETILPPYSEEAVREYADTLSSAKSSAAVELQKHVYKNYTEFIKISKEISNILFIYYIN